VQPAFPQTRGGAVAFTRAAMHALDSATHGGDVASFARLASPTCTTCSAAIASIRRSHRRGSHLRAAAVRVVSVRSLALRGSVANIRVIQRQAAGSLLDRRGRVLVSVPRLRRIRVDVQLLWTAQGWSIVVLDQHPGTR
jgi:hypothetical protein